MNQIIIVQYYKTMLATEKNGDVVQQIKKLVSRIDNLNETKSKLFQYFLKTQQAFSENSKKIKNHIENFQDLIIKKSFYSISKCLTMKKVINVHKQFCTFVESFSRLNLVEIKKINTDTNKCEEKLRKKSENFIKSVEHYTSNQRIYNKDYSQYQKQCLKLDEIIQKFKTLQNPINFYNLNTADDFSKILDKKFQQSQNKESSLISSLQLLDQTRKLLSENLKEIKEDYLILLNSHMANIYSATACLVDLSKDQIQSAPSYVIPDGPEGDVFKHEIKNFDEKYGKNSSQQNELLDDLKQLFSSSQDIQISSDERLFLDRCETFIKKKYDSVEQFFQLQRKMLEQIENQIQNCEKLTKEINSVQKSVFKSNGPDNFKKTVRKYFGEGTSNLIELCFFVIDSPRRRFEKIGKNLQSHNQKLKRNLQKKDQQYKKFKKRITQILSEHTNALKEMQNNSMSVGQYKNNIEKTFSTFKNCFQEFTKTESSLDKQFDQVLKIYISFIAKQSSHSLLKYLLSKEKEKFYYNLFKKFNSDNQIIEIVKQDTRYDVLFNDPLKPSLFGEFRSLIKKKQISDRKKIMMKKQSQSKGLFGHSEVTCCGMRKGRVEKYSTIASYETNLILENNIQKDGKLDILNKGLKFVEKKRNPFADKLEIIVPTKQLLSFCHKTLQEGKIGIQIMTNMGSMVFLSQDYHGLEESLEKNLGAKLALKDQSTSKLQKSSQNSSIFKQNNSSTEYKLSYQKSVIEEKNEKKNTGSRVSKQLNTQNNQFTYIKKLLENFKRTKLLSESFLVQSSQESQNFMRFDYKYQDDISKFLLKEKKSLKIGNQSEKMLVLNYQWKISFPDMPMLRSFVHAEEVRIQLHQDLVNVKITENNRGETHLFVRKTFYNEITKMNEKLANLVVQICERQANVVINIEPQSQDSTILLDLQNLALDKEQVMSKPDKLAKKLSQTNLLTDLQKGNSRISGDQI